MPKKTFRRIKKLRKSTAKCIFCVGKKASDYKDIGTLENYITERGKIIARARTGICQKHQRSLTTSIKRARHLAQLPFTPKV